MSDSRNGNPLFVQGTEPEAENKAAPALSPQTDTEHQESAKSKAHDDVAALSRSARSDLSNAASALSAASAVAVLEKEADKAALAVGGEEEQAGKPAAMQTPESVIPEAAESEAPEASVKPDDAKSENSGEQAAAAPVIPETEPKQQQPQRPKRPDSEPRKKTAAKNSSKKKKKKKKKSRFNGTIFGGIIIVAIILTVSLLIAVTGIKLGMEFYGIGKSESDIRFNIPQGSDNDRIADILIENGVIQNKTLFKIALKLQHDPVLYPGDITLQPSNGYQDIIEKLSVQRESYKSVTVTFAEGENLVTVANKLEEAQVCKADDFIFQFNRDQGFDFEKQIDKNADTFYAREGYFYPDTYDFYVNDSAENVARKVKEQFQKHYTSTIQPKLDGQKLSFSQIMTLASLVQLEAASVDEMPNVASVFINRLNDPDTYPMLQSDTTSNYIKNVIKTQADTTTAITHYTESYDTYSCKGLPAGPICNPGIEAIKAVMNPAKTKYYYFCNNLTTKQTFYAETLEEHEANLKKAGLA